MGRDKRVNNKKKSEMRESTEIEKFEHENDKEVAAEYEELRGLVDRASIDNVLWLRGKLHWEVAYRPMRYNTLRFISIGDGVLGEHVELQFCVSGSTLERTVERLVEGVMHGVKYSFSPERAQAALGEPSRRHHTDERAMDSSKAQTRRRHEEHDYVMTVEDQVSTLEFKLRRATEEIPAGMLRPVEMVVPLPDVTSDVKENSDIEPRLEPEPMQSEWKQLFEKEMAGVLNDTVIADTANRLWFLMEERLGMRMRERLRPEFAAVVHVLLEEEKSTSVSLPGGVAATFYRPREYDNNTYVLMRFHGNSGTKSWKPKSVAIELDGDRRIEATDSFDGEYWCFALDKKTTVEDIVLCPVIISFMTRPGIHYNRFWPTTSGVRLAKCLAEIIQ